MRVLRRFEQPYSCKDGDLRVTGYTRRWAKMVRRKTGGPGFDTGRGTFVGVHCAGKGYFVTPLLTSLL